jgi:copper homeostasis protein
VLTSGQEESALKGLPLICDLIRRADGRIIVMPGGGINSGNARLIARQSGCREMHFAALLPSQSAMKFRRFNIPMGAPLGGKLGEYARTMTTRTAIRTVMDRAQS